MPDVAFVLPPGPGRLGDLAQALHRELERQGMVVTTHARFPESDPGRLYVLVDPGRFVEGLGWEALPSGPMLRRTLALTAQDTVGGPDAPDALLRRMGRVFDISQSAVSNLHADGVAARLLRPGYCPEWDGGSLNAEREIDIAVFDIHAPRRTRLLSDAAEVISRHRSSIHIVDASGMDSGQRRAVFRHSKIALQVHSGLGVRLDWLHAMDAIHAGAVLVAEQSADLAPFEPGRHLFVGAPASLPWVIDSLLRDGQRIARTRHDALERLSAWLPFAVSVGVLRAALIEMLGRPLEAREDDEDDGLNAQDIPSPESVMLAELKRTRDDLRDVRSQLDHLQASVVPSGVGKGHSTAKVTQNAAWDAEERWSVCALLTVGAGLETALGTLESLAASADGRCEIVIAWSGDVIKEVVEWIGAHPAIPVAQIQGALGLAATRNAALDVARAPIFLALDNGVFLYPRCVKVLVDALEAEFSPGFASALQALRPLAWGSDQDDAEHLRGFDGQGLAAPIVARTQVLREAGGFVGQTLGEGVESDDVWRRIPRSGVRVPEILSRAVSTSPSVRDRLGRAA